MKKALKIIGVVFVVAFWAAVALGAQAFYRFDLLLNPVAAPILSRVIVWGEFTDLTPKPFSVGQERNDVIAEFERAGFARKPDDQVWQYYESEILSGKELYQREANDFICSVELYVFVQFDERQRLESAEGTQHEHGCM